MEHQAYCHQGHDAQDHRASRAHLKPVLAKDQPANSTQQGIQNRPQDTVPGREGVVLGLGSQHRGIHPVLDAAPRLLPAGAVRWRASLLFGRLPPSLAGPRDPAHQKRGPAPPHHGRGRTPCKSSGRKASTVKVGGMLAQKSRFQKPPIRFCRHFFYRMNSQPT